MKGFFFCSCNLIFSKFQIIFNSCVTSFFFFEIDLPIDKVCSLLSIFLQDEAWFPLKEEYTFIEEVPVEDRVRGQTPPSAKEDCEVNACAIIKYVLYL